MNRITNPRTRTTAAIAIALGLVFTPQRGWADAPEVGADTTNDDLPVGTPQAQAVQLRKQAEQRFVDEDYTGALADFQRAYELAPHSTDLFNMGRIHEEMGELQSAVERYEEFVEQPRVPLEERAQAAERLEVLRVLVAKDTPPSAAAPRLDGNPNRDASRFDDRASVDALRARENRPLVASGATFLALGAGIALAGGLGFGLAARRASDGVDELDEGRNPDRLSLSQAEDLDAKGKDLESLQIASLATGAAFAIVGAALLGTGLVRARGPRGRRTVSPDISARTVGVRATWRF